MRRAVGRGTGAAPAGPVRLAASLLVAGLAVGLASVPIGHLAARLSESDESYAAEHLAYALVGLVAGLVVGLVGAPAADRRSVPGTLVLVIGSLAASALGAGVASLLGIAWNVAPGTVLAWPLATAAVLTLRLGKVLYDDPSMG